MKMTVTLSAVLFGSAMALACVASPASAASITTDAFLTNVAPDVDFLDRSSRMALDHSETVRLRAFAHSEAAEQTMAANVVDDWIEKTKGQAIVASANPAATNPDQVVTGRSVAIDRPATPAAEIAPPAVGQEDLDRLDGLTGIEFDKDYKAKQLDALTQLAASYLDYSVSGDDPVLKALALRELPKVNRRLADLRHL